ncbi:MAG: hypothetical protein K9J25_12180 [Bacteroidales bacterium]|nr:hypothetical protein [Bacteroidales bacterium]
MKKTENIRFVIYSLLILSAMNVSAQDLNALLPDEINGYKPSGKDTYYNQENLFNYINGGAELFISYNFDKVISRTYTLKGETKIVAEIFDMVEAKNAFGVFSHDRESLDTTYGQGSEIYPDAIIFWKDRYYISILASGETNTSKTSIHDLAAGIDKLITTEGKLPAIIAHVPRKDLVPESIFYFHHYVWLNAFYYIAGENILNIDDNTDAVLAKYGKPSSRYYLLLAEYKTQENADKAYRSFINNYAPELGSNKAIQTEDGKWMGFSQHCKILVGVFNAPAKEQVTGLLEKIIK